MHEWSLDIMEHEPTGAPIYEHCVTLFYNYRRVIKNHEQSQIETLITARLVMSGRELLTNIRVYPVLTALWLSPCHKLKSWCSVESGPRRKVYLVTIFYVEKYTKTPLYYVLYLDTIFYNG